MTEMTGAARVVMLDRRWPGDIADRGGDLLDVVFGWADFAKLRRLSIISGPDSTIVSLYMRLD